MQTSATIEPGALLRQRREELGFSLEQAAAQLNLKAAVIHQLESQQWDANVSPTFIRGYLRQYTRLLKLNDTDVLQQYDQWVSTLPVPTAMQSFSRKTSRDAAESRFMLATYCLLVLLIGMFFVWFWQTHMLNEQPVSMLPALESSAVSPPGASQLRPVLIDANEPTSLETATDTAVTLSVSTSGSTTKTETLDTTNQTSVGSPVQENQIAAANSSPEATVSAPTTSSAGLAAEVQADLVPSSITTTSVAVSASEESVQSQQTTPDSQAVIAQDVLATTPTNTTELQLELHFSAQCWVAVIAADGKRLAYSMQNSGQTLTLKGIAPLKVTLGDPAAVTASLNGNSIDLSGYKQGQVTRLTLTGSE